ncbi:MAG: lysozyme [Betaproteobacteria bacterium]|nr:lysozyme [Betaproteobacteria bacterium]
MSIDLPEALLALIRRFEGLRLKPYLCPAGVPTVGYGHTGKEVKIGGPAITPKFAEELLRADASVFYLSAAKLSPRLWLEGDAKHSAIADFCYNLGSSRYKISTLKRRIDAGNWNGAITEINKWIWGGGKKLPGLVLRRAAEAVLIKAR